MSFEKWVAKYVKENDNIDFDLIILEDMLAAWNASRIDFAKKIQKIFVLGVAKWNNKSNDDIWIEVSNLIDTELKKE